MEVKRDKRLPAQGALASTAFILTTNLTDTIAGGQEISLSRTEETEGWGESP